MKPTVVEITENYVKLHRTLSKLTKAPIFNYKSFDFYSNPDSHWFTRVILKGNLSLSDLSSEIEDLRSKGFYPDILDFLNTRTHEIPIHELGYNSCNEQVGMFLKGDPISLNKKSNMKLDIRKIETEKDLKVWLKILNDSFKSEDRQNLYLKLLNQNSFRLYGGFINGQMTTTGMTYYDGESFGLYSITTDRNHRSFGYASAFIERILGEIRKEFPGIIILHATEMGKGIYEKFGFEKSNFLRHWSTV
ncbi:GNAT family N-acetyltransferase [Leptospira mayottensis]|uniref:Acetyltransferase (GNAT) domain protein n=2 Tax=Leptospira mayottensis TaxID=1137606 RepID=A0AA87MQ83_9LEPT|nr:GNAT family N-acetyltransferase [Leptospira mayottensis]AXR60144.1 GNAT family N-acetyltransferase [Leptospira mayottensis]AXR63607.1 GNAT family N-acetyltransferase [Leptospira mayottensis]AZQ03435.1 GNAT family N-acetyltransferase [Leptospira mayottensis 200901116]EKR99819.1 acetyltransferase (GNAT) domain protein [Leptospira mayottensis 200901122]TGN02658.1 GNAT family N-acetyltransferase [Leptospira mayottensis]